MKEYSYSEAVSFFEELPHFIPPKNTGVPLKNFFTLDAETALLEKLGNPQNDLQYIHVAGTNGKGSTVAFISSILKESGIRVGTFASPYLSKYNELFRVNGADISDENFANIFSEIMPKIEELAMENIHPSEYEILTAMCFLYFKKMLCDIVVLEVSMGGRVDTTNVIPSPLVTVITPISYDHMSILGNTLEEIATEKAGIIKSNTVVVSAVQEDEVTNVLRKKCNSLDVEIDFAITPDLIERTLERQVFTIDDTYEIGLIGNYQIENASLAMLAAQKLSTMGFDITHENIKNGLRKTKWPGRFTVARTNPYVILDGGHNRQGAKVLRESLELYFPNKKIIFVMGILKDKEVDLILDTLLRIAKAVYTMAVPSPRTMSPYELVQKVNKRGIKAFVLEESVEQLIENNHDEIFCICGSLYFMNYFL